MVPIRDVVALPEQNKRHEAALESALKSPKIYADVLEKHGGKVPDRDLLRADLIRNRGFNPNTVDGFINDFMASVEYVSGLGALGAAEREPDENDGRAGDRKTPRKEKQSPMSHASNYDLSAGTINISFDSESLPSKDDMESMESAFELFIKSLRAKVRKAEQ